MADVVLKNVSKVFASKEGPKEVVRQVSFTCADEEFMILVGPSGCGKSTTLRMIAGLEDVTAGEIYIGGALVNDVPARYRDIAMVFQNYALYPHMTVFDNIAFGLRLRHTTNREIETRVREAAEILQITEHLGKRPKELSGGERQRVAVGRAMVRRPKVFLFDEPLSNLDAELRASMRADLRQLHSLLRATMIYVTHDQIEAMTMGDRIVVLRDGEVHQTGAPLDLYDHPRNKFVAGFIGNQRMNFIEGTLTQEGGDVYFSDEGIRLLADGAYRPALDAYLGKKVTLGVRPENIYDKIYAVNPTAGNTLRTTLNVILPTGEYALLNLQAGRQKIIAKVDVYDQLKEKQPIDIVLDMNKVHFFDPATEAAIG